METLGVWLSQTREAMGSTLREVEAATRIRVRFLEMLEAGDFAALPGGDVQARGFLRIYARYLGLSLDEVWSRYEAEMRGAELREAPAETGSTGASSTARPLPAPTAPPPQGFSVFTVRRRGGTLQTLAAAAGAFIFLVTLSVVGWYFLGRGAGEQARATDAEAPPMEATSVPTAVLTPTVPVVLPTVQANPEGEITVALEATEHVWVRITADGETAFQGVMAPEQPQAWSGQDLIVVETGNGAGLLVSVNDQLLGRMGARGAVSYRAWGPSGEVAAPSPTAVPTS
jgi:hypothetical protein